MTFRTPAEAVALANNTRYGLAASVWTENINLALDIAPKVKAGTVWINCTNAFDAASGFGGYRESGFGREGGMEGLWEYVKAKPLTQSKVLKKIAKPKHVRVQGIDRTAKLYIGGKQARPDGGYSLTINDAWGDPLGEVGKGNRKDVRNAVEKAHAANSWSKLTAHHRAQVLYYVAENLEARHAEFAHALVMMCGVSEEQAEKQVEAAVARIFTYAAHADKYDGRVHHTPFRNVTLAMNEPIGVLGLVLPNAQPLLSFVSTVFPAIAMGNRVVVLPSQQHPLCATDFYQVLDTSDMPGGVVNIITGEHAELAPVLANHDDVDGIWHFGDSALTAAIEKASAETMKRIWSEAGHELDWMAPQPAALFLRKACEVKNIWVPYGE